MVSNSFFPSPIVLSFVVCDPTCFLLPRLFCGFTNLRLLCQIYFPLKLTSLNLSDQHTIPANGLLVFSKKTTTLTSLTCSIMDFINCNDLFLIVECFPLLQELDLSNPLSCDGCYNSFLHGVETLSLSLFKLRKVNLSCHEYDQSLFTCSKIVTLLVLKNIVLIHYLFLIFILNGSKQYFFHY